MGIPMTGLPINYTSNNLYWQYIAMIMQQAQQQQQIQMQNLQAMMQAQQQQQAQAQAQAMAQAQAQQAQAQAIADAQAQQLAQQQSIPQQPKVEDGKDDGKISWKSKIKNFGKGIGNFFKGMVCDETGKFSIKRTLTTVGVAAGAVALTVATGGAATPFLIAAGATMGAVQVGKGAYKAATAKTDAEAERAWQDIGCGTTAVVTSIAGAKGALKAAGKFKAPTSTPTTPAPTTPAPINSTGVTAYTGTAQSAAANVASAASKSGKFASVINNVKGSLKATWDCFKISGNGAKSAIKGLAHPVKSARSVRAYYKNTMKPNLAQAFSYKNGHKNYTNAMDQKINKNIDKIDAKIKALNEELASNPKASRIQEIESKLTELNNQKANEIAKLNFNNGKNKGMEFIEKQITEIEAKIADPNTSAAEKAILNTKRNQLYEMANIIDTKYKTFVNQNVKAQENYIAQLKEQLKTASKDEAANIKAEIKTQETYLKAIKSQKTVEIAQHNVQKAEAEITKLNLELKKAGITDAQKEAISSRIKLIENAIKTDKKILRNANYKVAAQATLPKVGLAYGSYYLGGRSYIPEGISQEELEAFYQAQQQAMAEAQAQAQAQAQQYQNQMTAQNAYGYNQAPQYNASLFTMQPPMGTGLGFEDLYRSPYPEMLF